ncbi:MAG: hypothetical protein ACXVEJ_14980 [Nocardioides sp.]
MNSSLPIIPQPRRPHGETALSREHVLRLGRLSAAVVTAGILLTVAPAGADAAPGHRGHHQAHHAGHQKKARVAAFADARGDVATSRSLLRRLPGAGRRTVTADGPAAGDADLTGATVTRDGSDLEISYDTARDFTGEQGLTVPGLVDLSATEAYHLAIHAAGGATVYSATGTMSGDGTFASDDATMDADGSVTFTVPVAALPKSGQLHVAVSTDLAMNAAVLGDLVSANVAGHLTDTLDFGYRLGS